MYFITTEGRTGVPFVDANMRELAMTGFMSNRGRQNVASFLTKDLGLDWRMGAEWFEYLLVSECDPGYELFWKSETVFFRYNSSCHV